MKKRHTSLIQPDARGRIQLPSQLRQFPLFRLEEENGKYGLIPLRFEAAPLPREPLAIWLTPEVEQFLESTLFAHFSDYMEKNAPHEVVAAFLYGSRARKDALSRSDFDFGLLCEKYPSATTRHLVADSLVEALKNDFDTLKKHGVDAEPSIHFFSHEIDERNTPPIYYSVVTDGRVIWQKKSAWNTFTKKVESIARKNRVTAQGQGRHRRWTWPTK